MNIQIFNFENVSNVPCLISYLKKTEKGRAVTFQFCKRETIFLCKYILFAIIYEILLIDLVIFFQKQNAVIFLKILKYDKNILINFPFTVQLMK